MDFDEILCDQHMKFSQTFQQSHGPWLMLKFQFFSISIEIMNGFRYRFVYALIFMVHVVTNTHYFPKLFNLIDFRIMFMLNIMWNNWWIWSNLVRYIDIFLCQNLCSYKNKHSGRVSYSACNAFIGVVLLQLKWLWGSDSSAKNNCNMEESWGTFFIHF